MLALVRRSILKVFPHPDVCGRRGRMVEGPDASVGGTAGTTCFDKSRSAKSGRYVCRKSAEIAAHLFKVEDRSLSWISRVSAV